MKTCSFRRFGFLLVPVVVLVGATAASAQQPQPPAPDLGALLQGIMQQANQPAQNAPALVDFRALKAQLPPELPEMKRVSAGGEKSGAFGMSVAFAEATYRGDDGGTISIKITDNGGMGGLAAMAQAGFAAAEVDRETETGYERTTTIHGHRAMEKYDNRYQTGSITIMTAKRLTFEIKGQQVPMEKITGAVEALDFDAIIGLIDQAGKEPPAAKPLPPEQ